MRRRAASFADARLSGHEPGEAALRGARPRPAGRRTVAGLLLAGAAALAPLPAAGQTLMTQPEALELAFPDPVEVERRTAYLSEAQLASARARAGGAVTIDQGVVTYYVGHRAGRPTGAAYFDVHRIRTKKEVVMVVVDPDDRIRRVDVLKFAEPPEYRAPEGWIEQLEGRPLDDALSLRAGIRNLTGATLTAGALTRAARRVLALHGVIDPFGVER